MNGKKLCKVIFTPGTINIDNIITSTSWFNSRMSIK